MESDTSKSNDSVDQEDDDSTENNSNEEASLVSL